jgi:hypothetical protein
VYTPLLPLYLWEQVNIYSLETGTSLLQKPIAPLETQVPSFSDLSLAPWCRFIFHGAFPCILFTPTCKQRRRCTIDQLKVVGIFAEDDLLTSERETKLFPAFANEKIEKPRYRQKKPRYSADYVSRRSVSSKPRQDSPLPPGVAIADHTYFFELKRFLK